MRRDRRRGGSMLVERKFMGINIGSLGVGVGRNARTRGIRLFFTYERN